MNKKIFVSGCYDLLHSGHVAFFKEASQYGDLYVGIGSDATIKDLKGRETINSEQERLYMVKAIRYVKDAWINAGSGIMDFEEDMIRFRPDVFIVNEDGHSPHKEAICKTLGIEYRILSRIPDKGLPSRSTTDIRSTVTSRLPYRLDLAGTWIDQPYVSQYYPGWAITISLEPIIDFNERCGMSTSTRNAAARLWPYELPAMHPEKLAQLLFRYENEPGTKEVSGAQDAIGICMPGLNRHYYDNTYWPSRIESVLDETILSWLENNISLVLLWPRPAGTNLLKETRINRENVKSLAAATDICWEGILKKDLQQFAEGARKSFDAQVRMFPAMVPPEVKTAIEAYKDNALAWKLAGAGGGGYLALISEKPIPNAIRIKIRRKNGL
ncbi:MAG: adenylyltransferase/cytidyltransferase family protein [Dysgonamonadaceae bacterium]|jgi:cytidyltransferase-like protein|nr:adenylyltransferase/cytidyltransferase family protein [Dysgonamonadaceae bacterium]